ncbi:MAG TPA: hypothetical protein VK642_01635 [Burkholderiales bacterium]|nr:hypothetical protein [Burkholderiales bacterium]
MESSITSPRDRAIVAHSAVNEAYTSGVSWAAIIAGAVVAASFTLILVSLGSGLGFTMVSPWANEGASATAVGITAVVWLIATQLIASALGGYLAGRLRTKWVDVHTDEVFFRDTAHGLLAWGVSVVISAALLASAATSLIGGAAKAGGTALAAAGVSAAGIASKAKSDDIDSTSYFTDALLRKAEPTADDNDRSSHEEVSRILINSVKQGDVSPLDKEYLAKVVAARNGVSVEDANKRVTEVIARVKQTTAEAKQAADTARKVAAQLSLWTFLALLIGAFCASYAATIGGRQRDHVTL